MGDFPVKSVQTAQYDRLIALIKQLRVDARVTQKALCHKLGQDAAYISKIERGVRRIDVVEFCDISMALGVDPKELFSKFVDPLYSSPDSSGHQTSGH